MRFYLPLSLFLLALDRLTKQLALFRQKQTGLSSGQFTPNPGWFFFNLPPVIFIPLSLLILYFLFHQLVLAYHARRWLTLTSLLLILAGGFSNLYDRLVFGFVIDWISFPFLPISVFNLADVMIFVGVGLLFLKL